MATANPLEELVLELADYYPEMVEMAAEHFAPRRPWWSVDLTPDQQLGRWLEIRDPIMGWLVEVAAYIPGMDDEPTMLGGLEELFTGPVEELVPAVVLVDERADSLKALVQAQGPKEAAKHIRKMETLLIRRMQAEAIMAPAANEAIGFDLEAAMAASPLPAPPAMLDGMVG